ncbi:hypothetical protein MUGA111182_13475 [Mucilaginibacter galii]|uniref:Uncharacterized protein n=1 Tax=Mucilaginibacter galii TaxID=2005073 RepID=A0A917J852_9SPHI|nr:hypothetical protein [Mucilaginibacter galii]GGI49226.1 hypothetical protein GCM10011425_04380 [Mucilaginibacter galii]
MSEIKFKYKIDELLKKFSITQYRLAMRMIPEQLNVSAKTFANYRNIKLNDSQDIPHEKVVILENLFDLAAGKLQNFVVTIKPITEFTETNI